MATETGVGECRTQRLVLPGGERTWTVLGRDHLVVGPFEEYLEYLRAQRCSPNTVKSYARGLALWWEFLGQFELEWARVTLETFGSFLTWLRTGQGPQRTSQARAGQTMSPDNIWLAGRLHEHDALGRIIVKLEQTVPADGSTQAIAGAGVSARTDARAAKAEELHNHAR